jgi:hypothetical protein
MAATMKNAIFWDVMPCGSCKNQHFEGRSVFIRATGRNNPEDSIFHASLYRPPTAGSTI